ncbi:uncharacterized protein N7500_009316 [Penicillium coprophilum]|uniref:uncharacterized protein n=1 Tax=Penicillium coprophilum TaxID=36646 RepID=UPI0023A68CF3|nr:uncharacterized protein N7500_009316 [Penicillium coprophilum]KAJ5153877.1 hypothetical protein N7500_009316 [Penicillium coprophilum]
MCLYLYASLSVKISLLVFIRRIFIKPWMNRLTMCMIVFQVLFSVSGSFVLALQCDPPRAVFDLTVKNPTCYSQYKLFQITLYQAVFIFVCDVIILLAPMFILCKLQMPTRKVIALVAIFGSGVIACISPVVRFSTLDYLRNGTTDLTYDSSSSLYWMAIEFNLGLVAGSLSSLRPLPLFRRFGSSTHSQDKGSRSAESHELGHVHASEPRSPWKKNRMSIGMGGSILQDSVNDSQERIIHAKADYVKPEASD